MSNRDHPWEETDFEKKIAARNESIRKLHSEGVHNMRIAEDVGVSLTTVYAVLNDYKPRRLSTMKRGDKVELNPSIDYATNRSARNEAIVRMFCEEHLSLKEISAIFGLSVSGVSKTVMRHKDKYIKKEVL